MTKEEKLLLIKELCARLPYNICVLHDYSKKFDSGLICYLSKVDLENKQLWAYGVFEPLDIESVKPYLRPMSSMTEDEKEELVDFGLAYWDNGKYTDEDGNTVIYNGKEIQLIPDIETYDWLNAHHFDYRGLIEKSLAIIASEDMYK